MIVRSFRTLPLQRGAVFKILFTCILLCPGSFLGCHNPEDVMQRDYITPLQVQDWRDEIIYQLFVDRFADGDLNNNFNVDKSSPARYHGGDWRGIIQHLDYLEDLGVTAIWISPVVKNVEEDAGYASYHGYWTQNFKATNPHFGDLTALRDLVNAAHQHNIKVILDVVTNHIGQLFYYDMNGNGQPDEFFIGGGGAAYGSANQDFPASVTRTTEWDPDYDSRGVQGFTSLGEFGPAPIRWMHQPEINRVPPEPAVFQNPAFYNRRGRVTVWRHEYESCQWVTKQSDPGDWWQNPACQQYVREQEIKGDFPGGLKDLDTSKQEVKDALYDAFAYWIEIADFDGLRIDTLKHLEHEFLQDFCNRIRRKAKQLGKRNFYIFGEVFDGHDDLLASYVGKEQVDAVFYFSQKYVAFEGVFQHGQPTQNITKLFWQRLGASVVDNNSALAKGLDPQQVEYPDKSNSNGPIDAEGNPVSPRQLMVNFLDNHDVARFRFQKDDSLIHHNALFFLLTEDGLPCMYYGTEQRFNGGNDPANREDLWKSGYDRQNGTFRHIKTLLGLRKKLAPLRRGTLHILWSSDKNADDESREDAGVFAFERRYKGQNVLVVLSTNNKKKARPFAEGKGIPTSFKPGTRLVNVFCQEDESKDFGAHICSETEQSKQTYTVGPAGEVGENLWLTPRSGVILIPEGTL